MLLLLRAFAATLQLFLANLVGFAAAVVALAPVLWRRSPLGSRLAPAPRQARVIQLPQRRRAAPH
jgi:hypothetical protein